MRRDVVGVILAGGGSRRMGRDKALLSVDGTLLVERAASLLATVCEETVLSVGRGRRYRGLSLVHVEDERPDSGPLAALEAALAWAAPRGVLALACDLPRVETSVLERLLLDSAVDAAGRATAWLACRGDRVQPLCGVYSTGCLGVFASSLDRGERSVFKALESLDSHCVSFDDLASDPFLNVNTPADYTRAGGRMAAL